MFLSGQSIPDPILTCTQDFTQVSAPITDKKELLDVNRDEASPRHLYCRSYKRRANGAWISAEGYREGGRMEGP